MRNKKAFTLIEIIVSIIVASIILSLSYSYYKQSRWYEAVNKMDKELFYLADKGVMNTVTGYINGTGGDCSNSNEYTNLSAGRMIDCTGYGNAYPYGGVKSNNGTQSYIKAFLREYMPSGKTCKLYYDDKSSNEFYMYLDCSDVKGGDRAKKYIEQKVSSYMKQNFTTIYENTDFNSNAVNRSNGGNDHDGKIRILFKK